MNFPIPASTGQPYDSKPYRTGAFVLTNHGWFYTARPETYRLKEGSQAKFPFYTTPDHMRPNDHV